MQKKTLPQLVTQAQKQDENAFNELYRRYHKLVRYIAYGLTKNQADTEEIVQEVFIQVQRSIADIKDPNQFKAWISRITYSKVKMLFRKNREVYMDDEYLDLLQNREEVRGEYLPHKLNRHQSDMEVLYTCLQRLKPYYREVLLLYYFSGLNIKEIMDVTQLAEGTVKSRLLYAKKYLRSEVEHYEQESGERISFQGRTLEAALFAFGSSLVAEPMIFIPFTNIHFVKPSGLMMAKIGLITVLSVGGIGGIYAIHQSRQAREEARTVKLYQFPSITYHEQTITTAKEAYKVLIDFADCDVEMREKSQQELSEIRAVYDTLMDYGEGYAELLQRRNWDLIFEKYR